VNPIIAASAQTSPYEPPPVWRVLTEVGYFAGLCALLGGLATVLLAVLPAHRRVQSESGNSTRYVFRIFPAIGAAMIVLLYFQQAALAARAGEFAFSHGLRPDVIGEFLTAPKEPGEWISQSTLRLIQVVLLVGAALLAVGAGRRGSRRLGVAALAVGVVGEVVASTPTAFAQLTVDDWLKTILTQVHILGALVWLGGLGVLATLSWRAGSAAQEGVWNLVWSRFSVLAMTAAGGILVSGMWMSWQHVGAFGEFLSTSYGRFLLAKIALVGVMLAAGGYNQVVLLPRIARAVRVGNVTTVRRAVLTHFPKVAAFEAVLGLAVLFIVPFLSGSARKESGSGDAAPFDVRLLLVGLLLIASMLASFWITSRVARSQASRPLLTPMPGSTD
jgi:copper transport protein